jgi:hypothetical protein
MIADPTAIMPIVNPNAKIMTLRVVMSEEIRMTPKASIPVRKPAMNMAKSRTMEEFRSRFFHPIGDAPALMGILWVLLAQKSFVQVVRDLTRTAYSGLCLWPSP